MERGLKVERQAAEPPKKRAASQTKSASTKAASLKQSHVPAPPHAPSPQTASLSAVPAAASGMGGRAWCRTEDVQGEGLAHEVSYVHTHTRTLTLTLTHKHTYGNAYAYARRYTQTHLVHIPIHMHMHTFAQTIG